MQNDSAINVRGLADTVGFAHTATQMDSVMKRIEGKFSGEREKVFSEKNVTDETAFRLVICPHDDYAYAGDVYTYALKNIKAKTVLIFGVAHKAKNFNIENQLVFDSFTHWSGCYGNVKVSSAREEIISELLKYNLPVGVKDSGLLRQKQLFQVNDSMQQIEHSAEAIIPFLQYYNRDVEIISILVPYMSFDRVKEIAKPLSGAIFKTMAKHQWQWGKDFAMVISNDCVHYGDEGWGGKNNARYGCDSTGYKQAVKFEDGIIRECLTNSLSPVKINSFTQYTVQENNFREYKWTWCGRYSVPLGLLTAKYMEQVSLPSDYKYSIRKLEGIFLHYATSIDHPHIKVDDLPAGQAGLGMGITAPANLHHWVGYAAIGY